MIDITNTMQNVGAGLAPAQPHTADAYMPSVPARPLTTRALVLRAPGINCDRETAHACRLVGFTTDLLHINQLLKDPERLVNMEEIGSKTDQATDMRRLTDRKNTRMKYTQQFS